MLNKKAKSIIAMLLSLLMIIGMVPAMAFADDGDSTEGKEVNLLVLGNSMSSGYGMPDFNNDANGFSKGNNDLENWSVEDAEAAGLGRMSESAYPWQLKKYLLEQDGVDKVNLEPICLNGMRTDELRAFLDENFYNNAKAREYRNALKWMQENNKDESEIDEYAGFLTSHFNWYFGDLRKGGATTAANYEAASAYVKDSIRNADVIVVDLCGNNFGTYIGYRLSAFLKMGNFYAVPNIYETVDDVYGLPDSIRKSLNTIKTTIKSRVEALNSDAGEQLLDAYLYAVADCIVNYRANMEWINQNKKEGAKVIAASVNNPMAGLKIDTGGAEMDFGQIMGALFDMVNKYIKTFDKNANNYYYANIPSDIETFSSSVEKADSIEDLFADGSLEDGRGAYSIDMFYNGFVKQFMGGTDGDSKTVYEIIQGGIKEQAPAATFKSWDALGNDDAKVTFNPGTFYLTVDKEKLAQASDESGVIAALGFSPAAPATDAALTKGVVKQIAAMYYVSTANQGDLIDTFGQLYCEAEGKTIGDIINDPTPFGMWVIGYLVANDMITDDQAAEAYGLIQNGVKSQAPEAGSFSELSETESVSFNPGTLYVTYNTNADSLLTAFNFSLTETLSEEDQQKGIVILTKGLIKAATAQNIKPLIQKMLYEAVKYHSTLNIIDLQENLGDMSETVAAITNYLYSVIIGAEAEMDEAYWALINIEMRYLLTNGVGGHPDAVGCDQKYEAIKAAYESEETAYDQGIAEIKAMINDLVEMLRKTGAKDDIDAIIAKIAEIQAAMEMLDEAQASMEELKELQALKARLEEYFAEALDLLGITVDDLIAQGQFIADNIDPVWVAEQIRMINEIIENWPEMSEEYQAKIEEYYEKIMDKFDEIIDELIRQKDMFENNETIKKIIETIEVLREAVKNMPKSEEEFKEFALEQMDKILDNIEAKAAEISEDLAAQIKEIREKIDKAVTEGDYQALIDELLPIGEKLLAIGEAVSDLPEYRAAMDEYMETSQAAMDGLDERVTALEKQMGKLTAKSIEVELKTKLTFPKKKAKVTLSWDLDEDAAGYDVTVNGKAVEPYETKTGMAIDQTSVKIGKTYKYEVTPYIFYEINGKTEKIDGKTVTKTFVPKVKLKKAVLKKVKAGKKSFKATWKKVAKADGYKLSYKVGKKTKTRLVKGAKKLSLKVKKLKSGKKYTVKVCAYKTVNGRKYYGAWSKAKIVKVK